MMDLSGKGFSPQSMLQGSGGGHPSQYCLPSLVPAREVLTKSLYPSASPGVASPAYSGSMTTTLSSPHTSYSNGHSIAPHIPKALDAAVKSYTSPAPVFNRHTKETFPYGISGVPMPSYGYHGDVYQFTSNGYPRKSRTCSYCGKVFTRSTTRRYHEKRCPLLRAAVSSYMGKDTSSGAPTSQSRSRSADFTPPGYKGPGQALGSSISGINRSTDSQELATSVLGTPPSVDKRRGEADASVLSGYQTSVIVKQEPHEGESLRTSLTSDHKNTFAQETLDGVAQFSPESDDSNRHESMELSPGYTGGMDLSKSPSHTSTTLRDEDGIVISADFIREQYKLRSDSGIANHGGLSSLSAHDIVSLQHAQYNLNLHDESEAVDDTNIEASASGEGSQHTDTKEFNDAASVEIADTDSTSEKKIYTTHKCGICGKCFENSGKLHLHEQLHTKFKPYSCKFCDMKFAKAAQRVEHEKMHNGSGDTTHVCAVCGSSFTRKYSLKLHMRRWHQEGPWLCRHCGKASVTQIQLKTHLYSHNLPRMERESLLYMPDVALNYSAMVSRDESSPSDGAEYSGQTSGGGGGGAGTTIINNTAEIMVGQETEMCQECGRDFPKGYMRYHLKSHEAHKPYACPICAKRFGYKNNMKSHIKLHTGVKPFQCKICGAKFTRGSTLRRHARRHGIVADSVWDLFVKPDYSRSGGAQSRSGKMEPTSATSNTAESPAMAAAPLTNQLRPVSRDTSEPSNYLDSSISPPSTHGSLYPLYASLGQIPPPRLYSALQSSTSYLSQHLPQGRPPAATAYSASSQPPVPQQSDALNLSLQKPPDPASDQSSFSLSAERSRSRSRSLSGSESRPYPMQPLARVARQSVGVQVHTCCPPESGGPSSTPDRETALSSTSLLPSTSTLLPDAPPESPSSMAVMPYVVTSPSQRPSNFDSTSPALSVSSVKDYSLETIASLISSGRMFKCFHCECYFSEYAMYRIHAKLHSQEYTKPFECLVCREDCHDRVYFALHLSEHLLEGITYT